MVRVSDSRSRLKGLYLYDNYHYKILHCFSQICRHVGTNIFHCMVTVTLLRLETVHEGIARVSVEDAPVKNGLSMNICLVDSKGFTCLRGSSSFQNFGE